MWLVMRDSQAALDWMKGVTGKIAQADFEFGKFPDLRCLVCCRSVFEVVLGLVAGGLGESKRTNVVAGCTSPPGRCIL